MSTPLVSICIPAYKAERYLQETLDTIAAQTFRNWELIITEDGSRDRTEEIVSAFAARVEQSVRYTRHDPNQGLPKTRNTGLTHVRGDFVAFIDADDLWLPDHLARLVATAEADQAELAFSGCVIFDSDTGTVVGHRNVEPPDVGHLAAAVYAGRVVIQPSAAMVSKALVERIGGFDPSFPICNDFEYWIRAAQAGARFAYTGAESMRYRKHPGAMSMKSAALIAETGRVVWKHRDFAGLPVGARRALIRKHYLNAARINRGTRPALALRQSVAAFALPLAVW